MSAETLISILDRFAPQPPQYSLLIDGTKFTTPGEQEGTLTLSSTNARLFAEEADDIAMFLVGFQNWSGYTTTATITRNNTQSIGVVVNYQDTKNYVVCGLSGNTFYIQRSQNGVLKNLATSSRDVTLAKSSQLTFEVTSVANSSVSCVVNGKKIFTNTRVPFSRGQTGIKIWDGTKPAEVTIEQFHVSR